MDYDIIIVGSGIVGSIAALALAKNTALKIAIIDSQKPIDTWNKDKYDFRVSAISLASQRIFQKLNIWEKIYNKRISQYTHMHVWEEKNNAKIAFDCADVNEKALGYIVEDSVMKISLYETFLAYDNIHFLYPIKLKSLHEKSDCIELISEDNQTFSAKLIIGADGANSWVRQQAGIDLITQDYGHTAIVTTVKAELPHQSTAWQCFLSTGPLAFLPLSEPHTSSIVWSTSEPEKILSLSDIEFSQKLADVYSNRFGKIMEVDKRFHFPLHMRHVKNYVKQRIALIGDAAHTIHPLAGQGVNMGILDAVHLVDVIINAIKKQRDYASVATLRRYERMSKSDNVTMLKMIEMLQYLFGSDKKIVQSLRSFGLNFTDRVFFLKNFFANYALGNRSDLAELVSAL